MKSLSQLGDHDRIDGIDVKKLHMHERVDQRAPRLFDGNGDRLTTKSAAQVLNPGLQSFWRLIQ